ncbi:hypothetical protein D3C71_729970 [compost metagenome]
MKLFYAFLIPVILCSCSESFKVLKTKSFNEKIASLTDIKTPEDLIKLYYDYPESEGIPKLILQTTNLGKNKYEITLIHEHLEDDSQFAVKIVMIAKKTKQTWRVEEIKKNWKCRESRGHSNWGTTMCD